MEAINIDSSSARAFNSSLKKAIKELTNLKVSVSVVNSYKFPDCYVQIYSDTEFPNDFKLKVFDACGFDRKNLRDEKFVSYGNITNTHISAKVFQWNKLFI